jgi:hypothetical protein
MFFFGVGLGLEAEQIPEHKILTLLLITITLIFPAVNLFG